MVLAAEIKCEFNADFVDFDVGSFKFIPVGALEVFEFTLVDLAGFCLEMRDAYLSELVFELDAGLHLK